MFEKTQTVFFWNLHVNLETKHIKQAVSNNQYPLSCTNAKRIGEIYMETIVKKAVFWVLRLIKKVNFISFALYILASFSSQVQGKELCIFEYKFHEIVISKNTPNSKVPWISFVFISSFLSLDQEIFLASLLLHL